MFINELQQFVIPSSQASKNHKKVSFFLFLVTPMEPIGPISEREWISLTGAYTAEESDFMANLLNNYCLPNELNPGSSSAVPSACLAMAPMDEPSYYSNPYYTLNENDSHPLWLPNNGASLSLDFSMEDVRNGDRLDDCGSSRKTRQCRLQQFPAGSSQPEKRAEITVEVATKDDKVAPTPVDTNSRKRSPSSYNVRLIIQAHMFL